MIEPSFCNYLHKMSPWLLWLLFDSMKWYLDTELIEIHGYTLIINFIRPVPIISILSFRRLHGHTIFYDETRSFTYYYKYFMHNAEFNVKIELFHWVRRIEITTKLLQKTYISSIQDKIAFNEMRNDLLYKQIINLRVYIISFIIIPHFYSSIT